MPFTAGGETTAGADLDRDVIVERDLAAAPAVLAMRRVGDILADRCC
jgi:hypothetical protein